MKEQELYRIASAFIFAWVIGMSYADIGEQSPNCHEILEWWIVPLMSGFAGTFWLLGFKSKGSNN